MRETLSLVFSGDRLESGMDAEDVAASIEGFAAIARYAAIAQFGDEPRVTFRVQSVKTGSLDIKFLLEIAGTGQVLLAAMPGGFSSIPDFLKLIKAWFDLLRHLDGKPPANVQTIKNGSGVQVQNTHGDVQVFHPVIYQTFNIYDVGRYSEQVVKPLRRDADDLQIKVGQQTAAKVTKGEVRAFKSVQRADEELEHVTTVYLKVIAPVFEGSGQWRFSRGKNVITATITDEDFLANVQGGEESFRAGDILKVRLRSQQQKIGRSIRDQHTVEEVLSHDRPKGRREQSIV